MNDRQKRLSVVEIRRAPRTSVVPIESVHSSPFEDDPIFTRLFNNAANKGHKVLLTRIPRTEIMPGHFRRSGGQWESVRNFDDKQFQLAMVSMIRGGHRMLCYVYRNPADHGPRFVCPDDENTLTAYELAGMDLIP